MGQQEVSDRLDPHVLRLYTQRVIRDLRSLEVMIRQGMIESGVRRIGMEQEMFLADRAWRPAPVATDVLHDIDDERFTTELARFNLEANIEPLVFGGDCLSRLEADLRGVVSIAREAAARHGADIILTGILPTIRQTDLDLDNMTPVPRYFALNAALKQMRGNEFNLRVTGIDEINLKHDSVMLESCNTSCQIHWQVAPEEFPHYYNIAQVLAAPIVAAACNSPFLFGKRLWSETRIAVFEQSIDTRQPAQHVQEQRARVSFGSGWVKRSILEIYEEDIARFRVFIGVDDDVDPFEQLAARRVPKLSALTLHNGTVYRWNRACYGVFKGKPHLRIENRVLPSGPTVLDEVANAALWFGLMNGVGAVVDDVTERIDFDAVRANFAAAVRGGLDAHLMWLDGRKHPAKTLLLDVLIPLARTGLRAADIDERDVERYLSVIENRVRTGQTGAEWMLKSYSAMNGEGTQFERLRALVAGMCGRARDEHPVHEWSLAGIAEAGRWRDNYQRVGQYMTTDVFSVNQDEVVDLITNLMSWRNIRHVPVEDDDHRLVGMVSYRTLLDHIARDHDRRPDRPVAVRDIMEPDPPTVPPDMPTREAIQLMQRRDVACLPVVKSDRLVGIVTEHDFMKIAAHILDEESTGAETPKSRNAETPK